MADAVYTVAYPPKVLTTGISKTKAAPRKIAEEPLK
jgi:hypothetical protein